MNMFDEARALRGMINMRSLTQSEIAKTMGVSQSYVANKIRLLNFSEQIQNMIISANLTERHARALLKIKDEKKTVAAIEKIKAMNLCVAASDVMIDNMILEDKPKDICENTARDRIEAFEKVISESVKSLSAFGIKAKYKIDYAANKKYITICIEE